MFHFSYELRLLKRIEAILTNGHDIHGRIRLEKGEHYIDVSSKDDTVRLLTYSRGDYDNVVINTSPEGIVSYREVSPPMGKFLPELSGKFPELSLNARIKAIQKVRQNIMRYREKVIEQSRARRRHYLGVRTLERRITKMELEANVLAAALLVIEDIHTYRNNETQARHACSLPKYIPAEILGSPTLNVVTNIMPPLQRNRVFENILGILISEHTTRNKENACYAGVRLVAAVVDNFGVGVAVAGLKQMQAILEARCNLARSETGHKNISFLRPYIMTQFMDEVRRLQEEKAF